jgi:hypothetical protein
MGSNYLILLLVANIALAQSPQIKRNALTTNEDAAARSIVISWVPFTHGTNGLNGTNGLPGIPGLPGQSGASGTNGINGTQATMTRTNIISGQRYTNLANRIAQVMVTVHLTNAAVNGVSQMDLVTSTSTNFASHSTITTIAANFARVALGGFVETNGFYFFTNRSVGANNNATIVPGSGIVTLH